MDNTDTNTLAGIVEALREIASTQRTHGDLLRMLVEGQAEIIKQLTPGPKDGPSLEELLSHIVGQLKELTGYSRQIVKGQSDMEQNLPDDVARAVASRAGASAGSNGAGRGAGA